MSTFEPALSALKTDGVICHPTEGVWGLACNPLSKKAFDKLLHIKQRPLHKGVIVLAATIEQLEPFVALNDEIIEVLRQHRDQFVTFVLPKTPQCPAYLTGGRTSVAVRVSTYSAVKTLCQRANTSIVSTSANISGNPPVATIDEARRYFTDTVDAYVDLPLGGRGAPSRILSWNKGHLEVIRD